MKKQPKLVAVINNNLTEQEMKESEKHGAAHEGSYRTIAETLVYAVQRNKLTKQPIVRTLRWENEATWAAGRIERDRNPGPFDPVYFINPADVPEGLKDAWLLPTVCLVQSAVDVQNSQNCLSEDDDWL